MQIPSMDRTLVLWWVLSDLLLHTISLVYKEVNGVVIGLFYISVVVCGVGPCLDSSSQGNIILKFHHCLSKGVRFCPFGRSTGRMTWGNCCLKVKTLLVNCSQACSKGVLRLRHTPRACQTANCSVFRQHGDGLESLDKFFIVFSFC